MQQNSQTLTLSIALRHGKSVLNRICERRLGKLLDVFMDGEVRPYLSNESFLPHFLCMYLDKATSPAAPRVAYAQFLSSVVRLSRKNESEMIQSSLDSAVLSSLHSVKGSSDTQRVRSLCSLITLLVRYSAMPLEWLERCVMVLLDQTPRCELHVEGVSIMALSVLDPRNPTLQLTPTQEYPSILPSLSRPLNDVVLMAVAQSIEDYKSDDPEGAEIVRMCFDQLRRPRGPMQTSTSLFPSPSPVEHGSSPNTTTTTTTTSSNTNDSLGGFTLTAEALAALRSMQPPRARHGHVRGAPQNISTDSGRSAGSDTTGMSLDSVISTPRNIPQPSRILNPPKKIDTGIFTGCHSKAQKRVVATLLLSKALQGTMADSYGASRRKLGKWCEKSKITKEDSDELIQYLNEMYLAGMKYKERCVEELHVDDRVVVSRAPQSNNNESTSNATNSSASTEVEQATVCYIGPEGVGCQLDAPRGQADGSVRGGGGKVLFTCRPGHGVIVPKQSVRLLENRFREIETKDRFYFPHASSGRILQFDVRDDHIKSLTTSGQLSFGCRMAGDVFGLGKDDAVTFVGLRYSLPFIQIEGKKDNAILIARTREEAQDILSRATVLPPSSSSLPKNYGEPLDQPASTSSSSSSSITPKGYLSLLNVSLPPAVRIHVQAYFAWDERWTGYMTLVPCRPTRRRVLTRRQDSK